VTFFKLLDQFKSASAALAALPNLSARASTIVPAPIDDIEREMQLISDYGGRLLCSCEDDFPALLKQFSPPPPILTAYGDISLAHRRCVAIVGARQASAAGRKMARDISAALSSKNFTIVSGLARGIDGEAHAASLAGGTIAVLGGGIDHIYPPQHARLYEAIAARGLLLSESPFGHRATARDFPRRNRIITGLAEGVVIIEAAERSGSLISARTALEQNREVMAIPGSPLDPRSAGSNRLLRQGATLVRHADDVIAALESIEPRHLQSPEPPLFGNDLDTVGDIPKSQQDSVRKALSPTPVLIEDIAHASQISVPRCATILVELELEGYARTYAGGLASLAI
jgi:DNA processing protein